jgi:hypothetical protein
MRIYETDDSKILYHTSYYIIVHISGILVGSRSKGGRRNKILTRLLRLNHSSCFVQQ